MLQSEAWFRSVEDSNGTYSRQAGLYIFNQFGLNDQLSTGLRIDGYKDLTKTNSITQKNINNISYGLSTELTWKTSEFSTIRPGFSHTFTREEGITTEKDTRFEVQFVFILGAHPAHSF